MKIKLSRLFVFVSIAMMLTSCMSMPYQPSEEEKALTTAILVQNTAGLEMMLQNGTTPNSRSVSGQPALSMAISNSNLEIAELLISYGADINMLDGDGYTALFYANKPEYHQWLIEKGIDLEILSTKNTKTAFETWCTSRAIVLSEAEKQAYMDILTSQNIPITREQMEETFWLTKNDITETIKIYMAAGYDLNSTHNETENTPLIFTAEGDNYLLIEELLKAGADPLIDNKMGNDPLNVIAFNPQSTHTAAEFKSIVNSLMEYGADINGIGNDGNPPLYSVAYNNNRARTQILLAVDGCEVNIPGEYGENSLFKPTDVNILRDLVAAGADFNFESNSGGTPLFTQTNTDSVIYLISLGADVNHVNNFDENILINNLYAANKQYTASYDYEGIQNTFIGKFEVLVEAGIDVNFDADGITPLSLARKVPFEKFVSLLEGAGAR